MGMHKIHSYILINLYKKNAYTVKCAVVCSECLLLSLIIFFTLFFSVVFTVI